MKLDLQHARPLNAPCVVMYNALCALCLVAVCVLTFAVGGAAQDASGRESDALSKAVTSKVVAPERFRTEIKTQRQFDALARVYTDAAYPLPHVMFVIDRRDNNKIYYVNSNRYRFHREFINGTYLSLERGDVFERNYTDPKRRFILGSVAYQTPIKKWTFEFWEGDTVEADLLQLTYNLIKRTFFKPVAFKPNSLRQENVIVKEMPRVLLSEIASAQEYQPLNLARGIGRLHIIDKLDDTVEIGSNEIVVLSEVPLSLPPVAGIIIAKPSTPLSHVNLLAKQWGVPNAYIKNANELFRANHSWWVEFETTKDGYT